ncbi:uncharacterized protein LOC62_04G006080 [Vanrija pseudolonga]|uniref:Uncharacterized protein n=1 Tax=Vanrija pseudolonga TaxID=143232 RepID=A0AAF0Y9P3_9TREE|nr:hypothetical protein LOC62_04G006080 [Vanrija pseudolonga]
MAPTPRTSPSASPTPSSQRRSKVSALKKATSPKAKPAPTPPAASSPSPKAIPSRPPRSSLRASTIVPLTRASIVSLTPSERSIESDDPFSYDSRTKRRSSTIASKAAPSRANRSPRSSALRHTTSATSHNSHGSSISFDLNSSTLGLITHAEPPSLSHGHSDSADSGTSSDRPVTPPEPISRDLSTPSIYDPEFVKHARTDSGLPKHVRTDSDLPKLAREDGSHHARTDSDTSKPLLPPKAAYTADKVRRKPVPSGAPTPALADLVSASDDALEHLELELALDGSRRPNRPRVVSVGSMDALSMYSDVAHRMSVLPGEVVPGSGGADVAPMYVLAVDPPLRTGTPQLAEQAAAAVAAASAPRTRQRSDTVTTTPGAGGRSRSGTGMSSARYELARNLQHPDTISMYSAVQGRTGTPRASMETAATATARGISATQTDEVKYAPREEPYTLASRLWVWGWLFPPLWLFGWMIICIPLTVQSSPSDMEKAPGLDDMVAIVRQTELKYARRCRNAFIGFVILGALVAVAVVLGVMLGGGKH